MTVFRHGPMQGLRNPGRVRWATVVGVLGVAMMLMTDVAGAKTFGPWAPVQKIDDIPGNSSELNTAAVDGCPIQAPDGLSLYMASTRPGTLGGIDIWVSHRATVGDPWGDPVNLGEPVNSTYDDFCPTPIRGGGLFFVSREPLPGSCGQGDIYFTKYRAGRGWREPVNLGCGPAGPNSSLDEMGPSYVELPGKDRLYFSSGPEIMVSLRQADRSWGPASPVTELNSPSSDIQPNVRSDGLEVVFASNRREGTDQDVYVATRRSVAKPFSAPTPIDVVNTTTASETRPTLSWDGTQLLFGRAPGPEGLTDIYVTTREAVAGG